MDNIAVRSVPGFVIFRNGEIYHFFLCTSKEYRNTFEIVESMVSPQYLNVSMTINREYQLKRNMLNAMTELFPRIHGIFGFSNG